MRGRDFAAFNGGLDHGLESLQRGDGELLIGFHAPVRQVAAQGLAPLVQVLHLRGVIGRFIERQFGEFAVGNRDIEAVAKGPDVVVGQLLGLVHIILALATFSHTKTFDGFDQQDRRLAFVVHGLVVRGVDFLGVVAATAQLKNFCVAHVLHHLGGAGVLAEEVFAHIRAIVGLHGLVVAVHRVHHDFTQSTVFVARQQRVPAAAPNQLDDIPAGTPELAL